MGREAAAEQGQRCGGRRNFRGVGTDLDRMQDSGENGAEQQRDEQLVIREAGTRPGR
jgi:hypothetical protein